MGLIGWLLQWPVRALVLLLVAAMPLGVELASLGGLIAPVSWLFNWLITVVLFALAAALIDGFRLKNGLSTTVLGAVAYSVISAVFIRVLGLGDVEVIRAALA